MKNINSQAFGYTIETTLHDIGRNEANHSYYNSLNDKVPSVTTIINKNSIKDIEYESVLTDAMYYGINLHECIDKELTNNGDFKESFGFKNMNELTQKKTLAIIKKVKNLIKDNNDMIIDSEAKFISKASKDNDVMLFAGCADLVTKNAIIDYKLGDIKTGYYLQVAAYAKAFNKNKAIVLCFDKDNYLNSITLNERDIEEYATYFLCKLKQFYNVHEKYDYFLLDKLQDFDSITQAIKELQEKAELLKQEITQELEKANLKNYYVNNYGISYIKPSKREYIYPEMLKELKETKPYMFYTKETKPHYRLDADLVKINKGH